jgi:hypothetical protein
VTRGLAFEGRVHIHGGLGRQQELLGPRLQGGRLGLGCGTSQAFGPHVAAVHQVDREARADVGNRGVGAIRDDGPKGHREFGKRLSAVGEDGNEADGQDRPRQKGEACRAAVAAGPGQGRASL